MATETITPREIVEKALHFRRPPRLPCLMGALGVCDTAGPWVGPSAAFQERAKADPSLAGVDEWGCRWVKSNVPNMGQVFGHPLEDIRKLDQHPMPDYTDPSHYVGWDEALAKHEAEGKYITTGIFMVLVERMHTLHGFENTFLDLYADRPAMEALADRVVETHLTLVREIGRRSKGRLHGIVMTDDWGTQQAAYVSFDFWMDFFFPRYKRLFDAMHDIGCDVWVHSCGKVNEIIEGYIAAGANAVNLLQPRALGIEEIGRRYAGRIAFWTLPDIQTTLPTGDRRMVKEDIDGLMTHWATPTGGFLFADYGDDVGIGVKDPTLRRFIYDEFSKWSEKLYGQPLPEPQPPPPPPPAG